MSELHSSQDPSEADARSPYPRAPLPTKRPVSIITVVVGVIALALLATVLFPIVAHDHPRIVATLSNAKHLALGHHMYASDYDDRLVSAERWMDDVLPYIKHEALFRDPSLNVRGEDIYGLAFFGPLSGVVTSAVCDADTVPIVFQSTLLHRNAASGLETIPRPPLHEKGVVVSYLDGHAKFEAVTWPKSPTVLVIDLVGCSGISWD